MELTITETNENFSTWLDKDFVTDDLKKLISNASILMVPYENYRDTSNPFLFPVGTEVIFRYFKEKLPKELLIDICISDDDYQEFAFFSNYKRLGNFIIKDVAVPIFVAILSAYVYDNYIKEDNTKPQIQIIDNSTHTTINNDISTLLEKKYIESTHIKFSVTVVETVGNSKRISYEGPASEIDTVLKSLNKCDN